jgi:hypothetical protein
MRQRYRIYVCPAKACAAIGKNDESVCPTHEETMISIIVRREDSQDKAIRTEHTAKRVSEAAKKVGEAGGKRADPFGIANMFRGMADDIESGRPVPDRPDDEDDEDEDDYDN